MSVFTCDGFRSIPEGRVIDHYVVDHVSVAARVFGSRLARRYSKSHRAIVNQDSYGKSSAMYQVSIVAPSGVVETREWLTVEHHA